MAFNPNYVPWMTILGPIGAGIGYMVGGGPDAGQAAMAPAIWGLLCGSLAGLLARVMLRRHWERLHRDSSTADED